MKQNYVRKRGNNFIYRRRIPKTVSHLDKRKEVKISLKTNDHTEACIRSEIYNEQIEEFWKSLLETGNTIGFNEKYRNAVKLARQLGFIYRPARQIASSSLNEIINRMSLDLENPIQTEAVLGGVDEPSILLSECEDQYWNLISDRLVDKSEHKIRKWKNPRKAAMRNFNDVVGDKPIHQITRGDVLSFRQFWFKKIEAGLSGDSANKQLRFVKDILHTVGLHNEISKDFEALFFKTKFSYQVASRPPFEADFVQSTLLHGLGSMNEAYQMILFVMADTGMRESEVFGLAPEDILLDHAVPHVYIRPRKGYRLKTLSSERKIPLVGTALYALKKYPHGFEQNGNPDGFSSAVNKYLRNNNLLPTKAHSAYSLRHTFKDRLRDLQAPQEMIDELLGHWKTGPQYGRGHTLEAKHKILSKMEFEVPNAHDRKSVSN